MVDLERLFRLRLVVARYGEMDVARWWNTNAMLGKYGKIALSRGFPKTHYLVQARVVFAVAGERCRQVFSPPGCMTIWNLPAALEDRWEDRWQYWLDNPEGMIAVFGKLEDVSKDRELLDIMQEMDLLDSASLEQAQKLRRSAQGRAVPLPSMYRPDDDVMTLLAAGFFRGELGEPAIPYAKLED